MKLNKEQIDILINTFEELNEELSFNNHGTLFTEPQITFVHYIVDWITRWGTLTPEDMKDDEFAGGADIFEIFNDNLDAFQRIRSTIESINSNAIRAAA